MALSSRALQKGTRSRDTAFRHGTATLTESMRESSCMLPAGSAAGPHHAGLAPIHLHAEFETVDPTELEQAEEAIRRFPVSTAKECRRPGLCRSIRSCLVAVSVRSLPASMRVNGWRAWYSPAR